VFLSLLAVGQINYVPNPGFEIYSGCPGGLSSFSWFYETNAANWMNGSASTSDYFHSCAGDGTLVGVPGSSFSVYQPAHSGDAYGGFYISLWDNGGWLYREYLQVQLTDTLIAGQCYYVEFWCAPANPPVEYATGFVTSDAVGAYFSEIKTGSPMISEILPYEPQVDNNATGNYINPPELGGWTKVAGFFEAEGDEAWACFGNFHHDDDVTVVPYTGGGELTDQPFVYFFLDDVLVTPIDSFFTYHMPDTVVCEPFELIAPGGADNYLWNTGDTTSSIIITATGLYTVTIETPCGAIVYDADIIFATDSFYTSATASEICVSELPYTLTASPAYEYYTWYDGAHGDTAVIDAEGIYFVTGYAGCATFVDTFIITVTDPVGEVPELGNDTLICAEIWELDLHTPDGFTTYAWSTGETTQDITVSEEGTYTVTVESTCETISDEITIIEDPYLNAVIELGGDLELCPPIGIDHFVVSAGVDLPNYNWSTGETTESITITEPGIYWVSAELLCSTPSDTIRITSCNEIGVPNAFSPNGDGINDALTVLVYDASRIISFRIFDRWGDLVYDGNSSNYSWDGNFNNKEMPIGTYVYILDYLEDDERKMMQGNILLVK